MLSRQKRPAAFAVLRKSLQRLSAFNGGIKGASRYLRRLTAGTIGTSQAGVQVFNMLLPASLICPVLLSMDAFGAIGTPPNQGGCVGLRSKRRWLFDGLKMTCNRINPMVRLWLIAMLSIRSIALIML